MSSLQDEIPIFEKTHLICSNLSETDPEPSCADSKIQIEKSSFSYKLALKAQQQQHTRD
jgi:hypothetical protein